MDRSIVHRIRIINIVTCTAAVQYYQAESSLVRWNHDVDLLFDVIIIAHIRRWSSAELLYFLRLLLKSMERFHDFT